MNLKEVRQVRKSLVERFHMDQNAPTTQVACRLIDEENLFAEYPKDVNEARAFLKSYEHRRTYKRVKPLPAGVSRTKLLSKI